MCNTTRLDVLAKTGFDFTFLAGAASQTIVLVPAIDVTAYHRAYLLVRLHEATMTAGQNVVFELDHTLPSDDDPAEFIDRGGTGSPLASLGIDSSDTPPVLRSREATGLQAALRLQIVATQSSTPQVPLFVEVSAALVLKSF